VGKGTVFTFALPIQPPEADGEDESPVVRPPEDAPLVLIVAPDLAAADGLLARLHQRGYRTLAIQEPDQAAVQADAIGPAAILCDDATLERHSHLLAQLQNDPHTRAIPVLRWREGEAVEDQLAQVCSVKTG
jgi:CheY-like chemotaxis protein